MLRPASAAAPASGGRPPRESRRLRAVVAQAEGRSDRWGRSGRGAWPSASLLADDAHNDLRFATGASSGWLAGSAMPAIRYLRSRLTEWWRVSLARIASSAANGNRVSLFSAIPARWECRPIVASAATQHPASVYTPTLPAANLDSTQSVPGDNLMLDAVSTRHVRGVVIGRGADVVSGRDLCSVLRPPC
jgi:hypothetical protein